MKTQKAGLFLALLAGMGIVSAFMTYHSKPPKQLPTDHKAGPYVPDVEGDATPSASLQKAAFTFAVTDIKRNGSVVSFTIPENARALEKKADAVVLSGLYASDAKKSKECPVVESTAVDKSVEDYSPFSGHARVQALFDDEDMAKAAEKAGCLLINDPI